MSTLRLKEPDIFDLGGLQSLLDLVFPGTESGADPGLGSLETPRPDPMLMPEQQIKVLQSSLDAATRQLRDVTARLQAASFRLGYMEALLSARQDEIDRLQDKGQLKGRRALVSLSRD